MNRIFLPAILLSLLPTTIFSQDNESVIAQSLVLSLEDAVKPGMIEQYTQIMKQWIEQLKNDDVKATFNSFLETNCVVNYLEPINNLNDVDKRVLDKILKSFAHTELGQKRNLTIRWSKYSVWNNSNQLSYKPIHPDISPNEMPYFAWKHIKLYTDKEDIFLELARKFKEVFTRHNIGRGYGVFCNIIGYENPWYTIVFSGKDPGELYLWQKEMEQELGPELKLVLNQLYGITEQIIDGNGWVLHELSYENR
ncbi:MAG: hypothetical protein PVH88_18170 [Ignavibacteria bacterium]|jgi:hypothetical protein